MVIGQEEKLHHPLLFAVRCLCIYPQEEIDLTPDMSSVGYIECTEDSVTTLQAFKTENFFIAHDEGLKQQYF